MLRLVCVFFNVHGFHHFSSLATSLIFNHSLSCSLPLFPLSHLFFSGTVFCRGRFLLCFVLLLRLLLLLLRCCRWLLLVLLLLLLVLVQVVVCVALRCCYVSLQFFVISALVLCHSGHC